MGSKISSWCDRRLFMVCFILMGLTALALAGTNDQNSRRDETVRRLTALALAGTNDPLCKISLVRVDGRVFPGTPVSNAEPVKTLTLSPHPSRVDFNFGPVDAAVERPLRLRYKLEGLDRGWREAGGEMDLLVIAEAASNHVLSFHRIGTVGESQGWHGAVDRSKFQTRRVAIDLPKGAEKLQVLLLSEDWSVLGAIAIANFRVFRTNSAGYSENIWRDSSLEEGENLDQADGRPRYWQRGSFGAKMAHVFQLAPPGKGHALTIVDNDIHSSASWQAELPLKDTARAGETLTFEWQEVFSVGISGRHHAPYDSLPPGDYAFRLQTATPLGEPFGAEVALTVSIPQVFWKRPPIVIVALLIFAAAVAAIGRIAARRRLQVQLDRLEHRRQMVHERLRIAQDIHDDLGASLTHISLISQTVQEKLPDTSPASQDAERLRAMAVRLTQKLDEIVWAVSPQHDTLESLLSYLTDFAEDFLEAAEIRARIQVPMQVPDWVLSSTLRHNVFLAAKETLNNSVKHAKATEIHLSLVITAHAFELTIEDNGCGFAPPPLSSLDAKTSIHHGLAGMRDRMASLGGEFTLDSAPGRGTRVTLRVPVKAIDT